MGNDQALVFAQILFVQFVYGFYALLEPVQLPQWDFLLRPGHLVIVHLQDPLIPDAVIGIPDDYVYERTVGQQVPGQAQGYVVCVFVLGDQLVAVLGHGARVRTAMPGHQVKHRAFQTGTLRTNLRIALPENIVSLKAGFHLFFPG